VLVDTICYAAYGAIDAAALGVVEPCSAGIGGGGFMLIYRKAAGASSLGTLLTWTEALSHYGNWSLVEGLAPAIERLPLWRTMRQIHLNSRIAGQIRAAGG